MAAAMDSRFLSDWNIQETVEFVTSGGHKRVALQFPDDLLAYSTPVASAISGLCKPNTKVAVLADSAFNPEAVDEVAAQHMAASCIVHYGRASLAVNSRLPVMHVFPRSLLDVPACATALAAGLLNMCPQPSDASGCQGSVLVLDQGLMHAAPLLLDALQANSALQAWHFIVAQPTVINALDGQSAAVQAGSQGQPCTDVSQSQGAAGYCWSQPSGLDSLCYCWVGPSDSATLQALLLALGTASWLRVFVNASGCPEGTPECGPSSSHEALVKRRYFLVEKARSASIIGILVGTLGCAGLVRALTHLRALIRAAGKQSYTMLVGKPNPAKLANFPEVEVWVQLSDPLGAIMDSRPYMAPLITPYEAVLALTGNMLTPGSPVNLGIAPLLHSDEDVQSAQLAAAVAAHQQAEEEDDDSHAGSALQPLAQGMTLGLRQGNGQQVVQAQHGAEYLQMRTWQGVEAPVAGSDVKAPAAAVEGLHGRAAGYLQELSMDARKPG